MSFLSTNTFFATWFFLYITTMFYYETINVLQYSENLEISAEQPYDSIPNFSAADALRLTGIGRNEFIDIMNKCRSKVLSCRFLTCILTK